MSGQYSSMGVGAPRRMRGRTSSGSGPESGLMRQQLVEHRPDREDVGAGVDGFAFHLFRGHVVHRPQNRSGQGVTRQVSFAMPKSRILTVPSGPTIRFAGLMSRWTMPASCACARPAQTSSISCSLRGDDQRRTEADEVGERLAAHVLHGDERQAVLFADVVDRHDVGMTEATGGARLVEKRSRSSGVS